MSWRPWQRPPVPPAPPPRAARPPRPRQLHPVPWQEIHANLDAQHESEAGDGIRQAAPEAGLVATPASRRRDDPLREADRADVPSRPRRPVGDVPAALVANEGEPHRLGPGPELEAARQAGTPAQMIAAAGRDAATADDLFVSHSKERLSELLGLPLGQRFGHLDDQALTPADRTTLRRSMMARLKHKPGERLREWWARRRRAMRMVLGRLLLHPAFWLILASAAAWFALARSNTPRIGYSTVAQTTALYGPQGFVTSYTFEPLTAIAIVKTTDEDASVRIWLPGQGFLYGTIERRRLVFDQ